VPDIILASSAKQIAPVDLTEKLVLQQ